jgi:hypothetical protein
VSGCTCSIHSIERMETSMIEIPTIGMIVIFVMALGIVSWQAERVRKAEEKTEFYKAEWMLTEDLLHKVLMREWWCEHCGKQQ